MRGFSWLSGDIQELEGVSKVCFGCAIAILGTERHDSCLIWDEYHPLCFIPIEGLEAVQWSFNEGNIAFAYLVDRMTFSMR